VLAKYRAAHHLPIGIRSKDNPADLISRGATPEQLKNSNLWWKGSQWLKLSENNWPGEGVELAFENIPDQCVGLMVAAVSTQEPIIKYDRYSSLGKLLRVVAYMLRFSHNIRCEAKNRRSG